MILNLDWKRNNELWLFLRRFQGTEALPGMYRHPLLFMEDMFQRCLKTQVVLKLLYTVLFFLTFIKRQDTCIVHSGSNLKFEVQGKSGANFCFLLHSCTERLVLSVSLSLNIWFLSVSYKELSLFHRRGILQIFLGMQHCQLLHSCTWGHY